MKTVETAFDERLQKNVTLYEGRLISIENSLQEAQAAAIRLTRQFNCKSCNGTGRIYWGDSEYQCAHTNA